MDSAYVQATRSDCVLIRALSMKLMPQSEKEWCLMDSAYMRATRLCFILIRAQHNWTSCGHVSQQGGVLSHGHGQRVRASHEVRLRFDEAVCGRVHGQLLILHGNRGKYDLFFMIFMIFLLHYVTGAFRSPLKSIRARFNVVLNGSKCGMRAFMITIIISRLMAVSCPWVKGGQTRR
jgi:hypothetical protein